MDLDLNGKTALVTGASYGLGYACAKALAEEGARVAICSRGKERLDIAAQQIQGATGQQVVALQADLSKDDELDRMVAQAKQALGHIDILILSTGHPPAFSFEQATDEQWHEGHSLILKPAIRLTRALLPAMRSKGYGRLLYVGSIFGLEAEASSVIQSTFRTGINAFSKCIANEAALDGVTANVLCPGYFDTPLLGNLAGKLADGAPQATVEGLLDDWKRVSPAQKFGKPEDFGALACFLASPRGEFISGTSMALDGSSLRQY